MATIRIDIEELLKERERGEVRQLLVDEGIANDLGHAEYVIALSMGESGGDRIDLGVAGVGPSRDAPDR